MRIGLLFAIDNKTVSSYLSASDRDKIKENCFENSAPAVNTLILSFLKEGHFLRVFTFAKETFTIKAKQIEIFAIKPVDNYFIKYSFGCFVDAFRLRKVLLAECNDLDVIHAHWTYAYAYASLPVAKKKAVYVTVRDWSSYIWKIVSTKDKIFWSFRVLMNNLVIHNKHIKLIANSPYTAAKIKEKLGKDVPIIPNSIKDDFIKKDKHINPDLFTIICISSSNDRRKNVVTLLKAYKIFRKSHKECRLLIIGSPFLANKPVVKKWIDKGLAEGVEFLGEKPHAELINYLDMSTVFVTPSLEETFGNTLIESIARKVPVIGGEKSGAIPYVLHHGKAGLLCDVNNPEAIAEKIEYVYSHPQDMTKLIDEAFLIINTEYSEHTVCNKHIQQYKEYY